MRKGTVKLHTNQSVASALANSKILPLSLSVKLGSIVVHADEMLSSKGHHFDEIALGCLLRDAEVAEWVKEMGAFLPVKR